MPTRDKKEKAGWGSWVQAGAADVEVVETKGQNK